MTTFRIQTTASDGDGQWTADAAASTESGAILSAVREDIRQTLRMGWIDPALDAIAAQPVFFTAAWSAVRPNVGKSFLVLARALRAEAGAVVRSGGGIPDLRKRLGGVLSDEGLSRIGECVKAAHIATVKVHIVVHAFYRAARRDQVRSTGREEAPVRRGIPEWQRWMSLQPAGDGAQPILEEAGDAFGAVGPPAALRLLARWPAALAPAWNELRERCESAAWREGAAGLRRGVLRGIQTLPHPLELQWPALKERGFDDADRAQLTKVLAGYDAAMHVHPLAAAFLWAAFGGPEIGSEA
jgi:hypothetical protein